VPADIPPFEQMLWPTLQTLIALGGSAAIDELDSAVIARQAWPEEMQAVLNRNGPRTEIEYRLAWARTYLKGMGLVTNSARRVWTVTEQGRAAREADLPPLLRAFGTERRRASATRRVQPPPGPAAEAPDHSDGLPADDDLPDDAPEGDAWRRELLAALLALEPSVFERLAQRLLREAGFLSATVTGRSGDGGIDGLGVYRLSLLTFPVFFQCKRYKGSVGSGAVRDFRGAMAGRGDKGLLITTGTFTAEARKEAGRDGAPPIDLIDGDRLCDLLREYSLGITTRVIEEVVVDGGFFDDLSG
jgi:restriction system protein